MCVIVLAACGAPSAPAATPATLPQPTLLPTLSPTTMSPLTVNLLYPKTDTEVEMGHSVTFMLQVTDTHDNAVRDGQVTLTVHDPTGKRMADIPLAFGSGDVYRSKAWTVPHRTPDGAWSISITARTDRTEGDGAGGFRVAQSISEILLSKYGFWIDAPTLRGIVPQLVTERGDAHRGLIRWGGQIPAQHILPENWVEIHWLEGAYKLDSPAAVRRFLLADVGDLGFTPVRDLGPFEPARFKQWAAWQVGARGRRSADQMEWMIFYAPEVNKTFALATTVVLPPTGIDPHAVLRDSFEVDPAIQAKGVAPDPLPRLLPAPELISPTLGTRFLGTAQPIVLHWQPVKELAKDEYYAVLVEYDYDEATNAAKFTTRQTQITLPETLYRTPNCGVFNWQVTLMRQTGVDDAEQPVGVPIGYNSLYWYVQWLYPPSEKPAFTPKCPNPLF
jgi:hypothetical protein